MVGPGVCRSEGAAKFAHNPARVGEKIIMQRRGDERRAIRRAENHVGEEMGVGVGQVLSPLRGWGGFYSIS